MRADVRAVRACGVVAGMDMPSVAAGVVGDTMLVVGAFATVVLVAVELLQQRVERAVSGRFGVDGGRGCRRRAAAKQGDACDSTEPVAPQAQKLVSTRIARLPAVSTK